MTPKRILVVEDEPIIRASVLQALEHEGYALGEAVDGPTALAEFRKHAPDLIVLDVMLPGISGVEVCRLIRGESSVPIILLTARGSEADKILGLEVGADDYITKPFSIRELTARIRAVLRRLEKPHMTNTLLRIGRISVDLAGHQILKDGGAIPVKPQVFRLLAFLVEHPGQAFSREQLLMNVWGSDYPGETRTVDVHIHAVRELIESDPSNPEILETIRGVGYVLRPPRN
ncbi:MAG: response regulator [Candidatus Limnocylindrus sp.]|jgi:DNA-binding response OmpR family regulator